MGNIGIIAIGDEAAPYYMKEMAKRVGGTNTSLAFIYPGGQDNLRALVEAEKWSELEESVRKLVLDLRTNGYDRVALATNMLTLREIEPAVANTPIQTTIDRNYTFFLNNNAFDAANPPIHMTFDAHFVCFWDSVAVKLNEVSAENVLILGEKADMFNPSIEAALALHSIRVFPMDDYKKEAEDVDKVIRDLRNDIIEAEAAELVINLANQLPVDAVVLAQPILEMVTVPDLIECTVVNAAKAHIERILSAS